MASAVPGRNMESPYRLEAIPLLTHLYHRLLRQAPHWFTYFPLSAQVPLSGSDSFVPAPANWANPCSSGRQFPRLSCAEGIVGYAHLISAISTHYIISPCAFPLTSLALSTRDSACLARFGYTLRLHLSHLSPLLVSTAITMSDLKESTKDAQLPADGPKVEGNNNAASVEDVPDPDEDDLDDLDGTQAPRGVLVYCNGLTQCRHVGRVLPYQDRPEKVRPCYSGSCRGFLDTSSPGPQLWRWG